MAQKVFIKPASIEDALEIYKTIVEFSTPFTKEICEERYQGKDKLIILGYIDDKPAGFIVAYDRDGDKSLYCWMAAVDPKYRRHGILKALMEYLENWAKQKGYNKIKIKTRNKFRGMLTYLVENEFDLTKVIEYPDIKENRILLEKKI